MKKYTYTVLITEDEIIMECDSLKTLYKAIHSRIRSGYETTALFYKNVEWRNEGLEGKIPFFRMGTE